MITQIQILPFLLVAQNCIFFYQISSPCLSPYSFYLHVLSFLLLSSNSIVMSNSTFGVNKETQPTPLDVVFPIHGGEAISTAEEEVLPSVEEIIPCNPEAKPDFQWSLEVMIEVFWSSMMAMHLADFKAKYGLPDQVELVPTNNHEVHAHHPWYCALCAYRSPLAIRSRFLH